MGADGFLGDDFLLRTPVAKTLYHEFAKDMPIYDYHCHLPPDEIAANKQYENLTQIWLHGDHYKWRAMRANGVNENRITGDASDREKFQAWAQTVPATVRNPLYHWTHMELRRHFGVDELLDGDTAEAVWSACNEKLRTDEFRVRGILKMMNVKLVCTTDDPVDDLADHIRMRGEDSYTKVYPAWRPDKGMAVDDPAAFNAWVEKLEAASGVRVTDFDSYLDALRKRHDFFHAQGCRLSDHGIEHAYAADYTAREIETAFARVRGGKRLDADALLKFRSCMLYEFALMDAEKGWVQQVHLGALRAVNSRLTEAVGRDAGFDSIGDFDQAAALGRFFDRLDRAGKLCPTILYNLNPRDNALIATMAGNFNDGTVPGKMQFGSGWWFLDQKLGMIDQINTLSNMGLLSRFVGMITDSRSFLSFPRHAYFRRILCALLGEDVANGELPEDLDLLGGLVQDVCYHNAVRYFGMEV